MNSNLGRRVAFVVLIGLATMGLVLAAWPFSHPESRRPTLAPLLDKTLPAVVSISVVGDRAARRWGSPPVDGSPARSFGSTQPVPEVGVGSGVIVDADDGIILSSHHVVAGAAEIVVILSDGRRFEATRIGTDAATDVAVLKIEADALTALPFGDSVTLEVGDLVVAVGSPFGLGQTVTAGIVSGLGRTGIAGPRNPDAYEDFIQTDASINPGSSGGALVDFQGALVGINTAIVSPAGGSVGIGFAVPVNMARGVMHQILEFGDVRRGRVGIATRNVTPGSAEALAFSVNQGAIISEVVMGSSAAAADLRRGDVIVELDGETIESSTQVRNAIGLVRPGGTVSLTIVRGGERHEIDVRVGNAVEPAAAASPAPAAGGPDGRRGESARSCPETCSTRLWATWPAEPPRTLCASCQP